MKDDFDKFLEQGEQRSPEWMAQRVGHLTCSRFKDMMDFQKSGKEGAKRAAYKLDIAVERVTNVPAEHYLSKPMQDGMEREPMCKMLYEARAGVMLVDTGFVHHKSIEWIGGSPDSLIGDDGVLECKAPTPNTHALTLLNGMDESHQYQIQSLLWVLERKWADFASYSPVFPQPLQLYVQRVQRDDAFITTLEANAVVFLQEVSAMVDKLRSIK